MPTAPTTPSRALRVALLAIVPCLAASTAGAQRADSTHWSLFASRPLPSGDGTAASIGGYSRNFGVGGSVEFRSTLFPIPLRVTGAYEQYSGVPGTTYKTRSLDVVAVFRTLPATMPIRPYLVGGFGVATQSPTGMQVVENGQPHFVPVSRRSALQLETGVGLEFRRFFVEYRLSPFAALGESMPARSTVRLGITF